MHGQGFGVLLSLVFGFRIIPFQSHVLGAGYCVGDMLPQLPFTSVRIVRLLEAKADPKDDAESGCVLSVTPAVPVLRFFIESTAGRLSA